ncbi:hypothetical protein RQN30_09880 [Arcanobacterium hippocoleae]
MSRPENTAVKAARKFGMRDCLGYMFGDFGNDFTFILQAMFLLCSTRTLRELILFMLVRCCWLRELLTDSPMWEWGCLLTGSR